MHKFTDLAASTSRTPSLLVVFPMRFQTNTHPSRQRSTFSTTALGHPCRRTVFVYASNAGYARGTLRSLLDGSLREWFFSASSTMSINI